MKVLFRDSKILLPDFIVVGAMRSGTTSLYKYLTGHSEIFMPSLKEPNFFSFLGENFSPHPKEIREAPWNLEDYLSLFDPAKHGQLVGEASASYLYYFRKAIKNIAEIYGEQARNLKIIGILRNPIDSAWSLFMLKKQGGDWNNDFLTMAKEFEETSKKDHYFNFLKSGLYSKQIEAYRTVFPHSKFFLFEELTSEPQRVVKEIFAFIGVKNAEPPLNVGKVYNRSGAPRNKLYLPMYNFLFGHNRLKSVIKALVPGRIRSHIKTSFGSLLLKRTEIPEAVKDYLYEWYQKDMERLLGHFSEESRRKIICDWMK
jgi:hypothetical protein